MIRCGHCGGRHCDVAKVYDCFWLTQVLLLAGDEIDVYGPTVRALWNVPTFPAEVIGEHIFPVREDYEYIPDEDGSEAYVRMLERRSENPQRRSGFPW